MEKLECPQCGSVLKSGAAVCGECGKEIIDERKSVPEGSLPQEEKRGSRNIYAILAVLLVAVGGAALLIFSGVLPNPIRGGGSTAAIVNGDKITTQEVDQRLEVYKKMFGKGGKFDDSNPQGKAALADMRKQILQNLIQEKILLTEAAKEGVAVSPQEIANRMGEIKKGMKLSDQEFEDFLKNHSTSSANFEKRIERELLIGKLIDKGTQGKGLTRDAWLNEVNARAKVDILAK